ncbi:MAG: hypothetical protein A2W26_01950 [Acidobacteria bacterium RBG_16_64_8]|nr:MAG: hypothetical protein A2W26_01950 [Acidobacteria bacterium RBG_16_64_8]
MTTWARGATALGTSIDAVVFDMDGVLLDSEPVWNGVRDDFARAHGGRWTEEDQRALMGANSAQWVAYMRDHCGVELPHDEIFAGVMRALREWYAQDLPLFPGAREAVCAIAPHYRLGLASSSPRELIEYALQLAELRGCFAVVVSSDEVARGKPEPDVYREACARLGASAQRSAAVEDSANGILAAARAGLAVVAIPNPVFAPSTEALGCADVVLASIAELTVEVIGSLRCEPT